MTKRRFRQFFRYLKFSLVGGIGSEFSWLPWPL